MHVLFACGLLIGLISSCMSPREACERDTSVELSERVCILAAASLGRCLAAGNASVVCEQDVIAACSLYAQAKQACSDEPDPW